MVRAALMRFTINNNTHVCRSFTLTEMYHDIQTTTLHQLMPLHLPTAKVANLGNGPPSNALLQAPSKLPRMSSPLISQSNSRPFTSSSSSSSSSSADSGRRTIQQQITTHTCQNYSGPGGHCIMITTHTQTVKVWGQQH